jgi:RimJ/RimL family protein N-acetyltransferase
VIVDNAVISTENLELAPLLEADSAEMAAVLGDERLHEFTGGSPADPGELRDRFRRLAAGSGRADQLWLNWIVRLRATGQAVGTVQATVTGGTVTGGTVTGGTVTGRTAAIAWVIGVPWQGNGIGSEAAAGLVGWLANRGATTVTACIHPAHHASQRVAQRAGLTPTDTEVDGERVWQRNLS